jgi:hypothetical protein
MECRKRDASDPFREWKHGDIAPLEFETWWRWEYSPGKSDAKGIPNAL